jgi:NADH dehydrogenase
MPPAVAFTAGFILGRLLRDVMITWPEVKGLMSNLLRTDSPPVGKTRLTDWARDNKNTLGKKYASELLRRKDRLKAY